MFHVSESDVTIHDIEVKELDLGASEIIKVESCTTANIYNLDFRMVNTTTTNSLLYVIGSTFDIHESFFDWNNLPNGYGSAYQIKESTGEAYKLVVNNSIAYCGGGGCFIDPTDLGINFTESEFNHNTAKMDGGGLFVKITHTNDFEFLIDGIKFYQCKAEEGAGGAMSL